MEDIDVEIKDGLRTMLHTESTIARTTSYANSWYARSVESAAMWEIYRKKGRALSMRSKVSNLIEAVEEIDGPVYIGEVVYVDHDSPLDELSEEHREELSDLYSRTRGGNALYPILSKREEFSHEHEIRAIYVDNRPFKNLGDTEDYLEMEEAADDYKNLNVDIDVLVDEIWIGPNTKDWVAETVRGYLSESDLDIDVEEDVHHSKLDKQPFDY